MTADCLREMIRVCVQASRRPSYFLQLVATVLNDRAFEMHLRNPTLGEHITFPVAADLIAKLAQDIGKLEEEAHKVYVDPK